MTPIETLMHEHQVILLVLKAAEAESHSIRETGGVNGAKVAQMLDFFRNFADKCHHAKEENLLFVKMNERGMPREAGPIAVMLNEHTFGRQRLLAIATALANAQKGNRFALDDVARNLAEYADNLRAHIHKEDNILYPMAQHLLNAADMEELAAAFDRVEAEEMGEGTHEKYHQLAHQLAGK
jgi:hemerythrin-like domain-containing protein